ncbi:MAG TPA: TonB-dependent receptor [Salinimicrobium sp.]|nr:TonB-dependent receptor [Salinimicrobium sp.]
MKKLFMLLLLAVSAMAHGQNSISGIVLDQETKQPIIGATIYMPKLEKGKITDFDGKFTFEKLPAKNYNLVISFLGFTTKTVAVELPLAEPLKIFMEPSSIEMEQIIISTPFHQLQTENVMKVARESIRDLSKSGAVSLSSGISQIAGVSTISTGTGIGKPVIRGLSSNRVLVFTQGVRLENQQFGGEHGLGLNASGIESVEVIKGPASLLYGSDAIGGVLYFNPEKYAPADSTQLDFKTTYFTNTLGLESNVGFKTSFEKIKFLVRGNYATHSDYKTGTGKRVSNTRFHELDLKTGIGYQNTYYKGDLRYNFTGSEIGIPEEGEQSVSKNIEIPFQDISNHILSLDNTFYLNNSSIDLTLGYLFNNRKEFEGHHHHHEEPHEEHEESHEEEHGTPIPEGEASLEMHLETFNYDAKYHLPLMGNFETIAGIQGMFQTNKNFGEEILIPDARIADFGVFATTHYHLENIDLQAGLRYDTRSIESEASGITGEEHYIPKIDRNFNSYNGALGVKFNLFKAVTARLNLATGFRAPNLAELTSNGVHHGSNRYEIGNPELDTEQNYQIDLALEYRNEHVELFANAFYNKINNYIYLEPTGKRMEDVPVFNYVQNDAYLYGGEAGIHLHPHPLDWLHVESSYEMVIGKQANGNYLPLIPAHSILNTLRVEFGENKWGFDSYGFISLRSTFEQRRTSAFETPTAAYNLFSAGLGGTFNLGPNTLRLMLSGTNLFDKTYFSHLSRLKENGIPNMGRNVSLSVKLVL